LTKKYIWNIINIKFDGGKKRKEFLNMKKNNFFSLVAFLAVFLMVGCATSPVVNKFMNPEISARDHALLIIDNNIGVGMIDGEFTFGSSGAGTDGSLRSRTPMILLMPGRHTLMVQYVRQTSNSRTTTTSDLVPITGNLLAGHIYRLQPSVNGNTVSFDFIEETDASIWDSKDLSSVKPPKKVLASSVINNASSEPATQFEGTWLAREIPQEFAQRGVTALEISFIGKSYLIKMVQTFTDTQLKGQNDLRKMSGQSTLVSPAYSAQRGTFEISGEDTLSLGALQITLDNDLENALWGDTARKLVWNFSYSLSSDGNLSLIFKNGDNQTFNYLRGNTSLKKKE
jgi:hypothetical protein